jgi:hypothetical protein
MDNVLFPDLDCPAHVQGGVEEPVTLSCATTQQTDENDKAGGCLRGTAHKPRNDFVFLQGFFRIVLLVGH